MTEESIIAKLDEQFPSLAGKFTSPCEKRIFSEFLERKDFEKVINYLHSSLGFTRGHHVVGTDEGENLGFIYLVSNADYIIFALKELAPKTKPQINSMCSIYPCLVLHECELVDLFGAEIEGLPDRPHYPLPDNWPKGNFPMRKEWKPEYFNKETMKYEPPKAEEAQNNG